MLVMVSLAFHLFVGTVTVFALCSYGCNKCSQCSRPLIQVVADSSLLDCCDFFFLLLSFFFFSTLCLQVGHRLRFWGGFSCFVCFIWCQLFACQIRAAIFRLPSTFVVWSFFVCHTHLWSVLSSSFFFLLFLSQAFVYSFFLTRPFLL